MAKIIANPETRISPKILNELKTLTDDAGQVVLHFLYSVPDSMMGDSLIRIWPTSYLYDHDSAHKSDLVHIENIVYYPLWMVCPAGKNKHFTLVFSGLPKSCSTFDFIEHCTNQSGAFEVRNIKRNKSDIYYLEV